MCVERIGRLSRYLSLVLPRTSRLLTPWPVWWCWWLLEKVFPASPDPIWKSLMLKPKPSSGTGRSDTEAQLAKQISIQTINKVPIVCKKLSLRFLDRYLSTQQSFCARNSFCNSYVPRQPLTTSSLHSLLAQRRLYLCAAFLPSKPSWERCWSGLGLWMPAQLAASHSAEEEPWDTDSSPSTSAPCTNKCWPYIWTLTDKRNQRRDRKLRGGIKSTESHPLLNTKAFCKQTWAGLFFSWCGELRVKHSVCRTQQRLWEAVKQPKVLLASNKYNTL